LQGGPLSARAQDEKGEEARAKAVSRATLTMTASAVMRSAISKVRRLGSRIKLSLTEFRMTSIIQSRKRGGKTMELESYFDFLASDDIRLKGTRVGIETILYDYIHRSQPPEAIAARYPSLTLEQVYATITYYLQNREAVNAYLEDWLEHGRRMREEQEQNLPPVVVKLRALAAHRQRAEAQAT
jgi:uncharacterized protein (DUF433 family)